MQIARASPQPVSVESRRRRRRAWLTAAFALLLCGAIRESHAAADCSITAVSLNFGAYDPLATSPDDSAGTVTVTCRITTQAASRVNYTVTISNGMNGVTPTARQMGAGAGRLGYNVFTDPARSQVWGTGTGGTVIASGAMTIGPGNGNGSGTQTVTHTVYGRIPQLQDAEPGTYSDTLQVTLTF